MVVGLVHFSPLLLPFTAGASPCSSADDLSSFGVGGLFGGLSITVRALVAERVAIQQIANFCSADDLGRFGMRPELFSYRYFRIDSVFPVHLHIFPTYIYQ